MPYIVYLTYPQDGATPLFKACHKGHLDTITELLKHKPNLGILKVSMIDWDVRTISLSYLMCIWLTICVISNSYFCLTPSLPWEITCICRVNISQNRVVHYNPSTGQPVLKTTWVGRPSRLTTVLFYSLFDLSWKTSDH